MEVHFTPHIQAKLEQMSSESGRPSNELVEDAVISYLDELAHTREMLDGRYDDIESGKVELIDGEEAYWLLIAKTEARRRRQLPAMSARTGWAETAREIAEAGNDEMSMGEFGNAGDEDVIW